MVKEITHLFLNTSCKFIKRKIEEGWKVYGVCLKNMKGLLGYELVPNRRIGSELADVARAYGLGGIIHSDELPNYGITEEDVKKIKEELECTENDAFILFVCPENKKHVIEKVLERLEEMKRKVPKDTRKVNPDGTTSFLRPQPGAARMYPETDHPLIFVNRKVIEEEKYYKIIYEVKYGHKSFSAVFVKLKERDPKIIENIECDYILDLFDPEFRKEVLKYYGVPEKLVNDLLWSEKLPLFERLLRKYKIKPTLLYYVIFQVPSEVKREISERDIEEIVKLLSEGKIVRDAVPKIIENLEGSVIETVNKLNLWKISGERLMEEVKKIVEENKNVEKKRLFNIVLNALRERADAKEIIEILNKILKE